MLTVLGCHHAHNLMPATPRVPTDVRSRVAMLMAGFGRETLALCPITGQRCPFGHWWAEVGGTGPEGADLRSESVRAERPFVRWPAGAPRWPEGGRGHE